MARDRNGFAVNQDRQQSELNKPLRPGMHVHLVGIGGAGLSAIAHVLLGRGFVVSGSDQQANDLTEELVLEGARVYIGHRLENIIGAEIVLISSAIPADNPEIQAARTAGLPIVKRAAFLGWLMQDAFGIAVAGSHGKTTTTGMIAQVLLTAGLDPSVIVGGVLPSIGSNGRSGQSQYFVVEADEYDYMFLGLRPQIAVITNVEFDHPDVFPSESAYQLAFEQFAALLPAGGHLVVCSDDPGVSVVVQAAVPPGVAIATYGLQPLAQWRAVDLRPNQLGGTDFLVEHQDQPAGLVRIRIPGEHNVRNALAAVAVGALLGVEFPVMVQALAEFGGIGRRFQIVGQAGDVTVIDDYAHHPTEIRATLSAARQRFPGRRLWAVWQPHTFSRTKTLLQDFVTSFVDADRVVVLDIFRSREKDDRSIDAPAVVAAMQHPAADYVSGLEQAAGYILDRVRPGDVIITLTAGDGNLVGESVLSGLEERLAYRRLPPSVNGDGGASANGGTNGNGGRTE
jgi:UDP-N-acetylmuramate--alanine ligase